MKQSVQQVGALVVVAPLLVYGVVQGALPREVQAAAPQLSLSQSAVSPGDTLTIKGENFKSGDKASVSLLSAGAGPNSLHPIGAVSTGVTGNGAFAVRLGIPQGTTPGLYAAIASDTHGDSAFTVVQVPWQIQVKAGQPDSKIYPVPGLLITVSSTGFTAGEKVTLSAEFPLYNGNSVKVPKTVTAGTDGTVKPVTIQVPWAAKDGDVPLTITGASSGKAGAVTVMLHVAHKPYVVMESPRVAASQNLIAEVVGFIPGDRINASATIAHVKGGTVTLSKTAKTGNRGIARIAFHLPGNTRAGSYLFTAVGAIAKLRVATRYSVTAAPIAATAVPKATATAAPKATATAAPKATATAVPAKASITVAPKSVIPGASAQILGSGFPASQQVSVSASIGRTGAAPQTVQVTVKVDSKGNFTASLHIPGDAAAGGYSVSAKAGNRVARGTVHIAYLKTSVVSLPARAIPGTPITVTGFGYSSGGTVTVTLHGRTLGTATATADGTFKQQFTVPSDLATGMQTLVAQDNAGRKASFGVQVYRTIATHFYFASLFTGSGFHEYLLVTNASATKAAVHITYQRQNGAPTRRTIQVPAHSRLTHDVNGDLGGNVTAAATVAADVPVAAERMVMHGSEGSIDPGAAKPAQSWYFANGNTSHQYREQIAVQNPTNAWAQVTIQVQPTHSKTYRLHGTMRPQSRMSWNLNKSSRDAIGVIVTANHPVVANRTIFIHSGISSKTGVIGPQKSWYFAAGPEQGNTRHWIGVINATNQSSQMVLNAYDAQGALVLTVKKTLRPYDRQGFLMNKLAGQTEVAVTVTTTQPSIAEQSTFVNGNHQGHTDSFGVTSPQKSAEFASATTWPHQDNLLALFNPNAVAIPIVVQFLNAHGGTQQQTYVVAPFAHAYVDVGKVVPNSQLGLLAVSSYPFVAMDRQEANDGAAQMTSLGTQS
jgi:hypothetical protein